MKHIKDPIHGYIDIPEEELSIINSEEFQRLRRIKQLGLSDTVYPSATHTRFSHSLGVMYLSEELSNSLDLSEEIVRANKVAGLIHDIGHLPFSHTLEGLLQERENLTHEDISCQYIDKLIDNDDVIFPTEPETVKSLIKGNASIVNTISNDIDADRLDYLVRDSYHTGINFGQIESDTILKFAQIIDGEVGFDHKSLKSVESLLDARMRMNYSVYSHNAVSITEKMLKCSVENYLDNTNVSISDFIGKDDYQLSYELSQTDIDSARNLFLRIQNRNLYKTSFLAPLRNLSSEEMNEIVSFFTPTREHEKIIAEIAELDETDVLIDPPKYNKNELFNVKIMYPSQNVKSLEDISSKPDSLRDSSMMHENIHVFCPPEHTDTVKRATKEYIKSYTGLSSLINN